MRIDRIRILLFMIISVACLLSIPPILGQQDSAQTAINSAQNNLVNCYNLAKEAESYGANITMLTATLNSAANLLSQAQLEYTSNNFDKAYSDAAQSQDMLNGFKNQASSLKLNAQNAQTQTNFLIIFSLGISVAILVGGLSAYNVLSKKERRQ